MDLKTEGPLRITITPDGKLALVPSGTGELLVLDTKSRNVIKRIPNVGTRSHGIVVSPDSAFAYEAAQGEAEIAVIDLKSFTVTSRIPTGTGKKAFDGIDGMVLAQRAEVLQNVGSCCPPTSRRSWRSSRSPACPAPQTAWSKTPIVSR